MRWVNTVRSRPLGARTCRVTRLAATALLAASVSAAANVAQATTLVAEGEVYPFVEEPPPAVGMPPIRRIRTTSTSIGVEAVADRILVQFDPSATSDLAQIHQRAATLGAGVARPVLVLDNGAYLINGQPVPKDQLDAQLHSIYDPRPAKLLFIKPGQNRIFQDVIEAMDVARGAGVQVLGFTPKEADAATALAPAGG